MPDGTQRPCQVPHPSPHVSPFATMHFELRVVRIWGAGDLRLVDRDRPGFEADLLAMGSSVPACPAFCASNMRRTMATAWVDVIPSGLSTTTQPCTAAPFRLRLIAFVRIFLQVTLDAGGLQQSLDLFSLGEGSVFQ